MMQTIDNRVNHPDIKSNIYSSSEYQTLKHSRHDYKLNSQQQNILNQAWNQRNSVPNDGKLGWDTSQSSIKSNKYYTWKPEASRTGQHYYYDAVRNDL